MASMGSHASVAVRRSIRGLSKITEPEVTRTRMTLAGLVFAVIAIGAVLLVWLRISISRLSTLTQALTEAGWRMLDFEYGMSYVEEIGRYSEAQRIVSLSNGTLSSVEDVDDFFQIYDKIDEPDPWDPVHDVAYMAAHSAAMRHHHEHLFELQESGGKDAFAWELTRHIEVVQPSADLNSNATSTRLTSLVDLGLEMHQAMQRLGELPISQMNRHNSVPWRFLYANYDVFRDAMNQSLAVRQRDFVLAMPQVQMEVIVAGSVAFVLCVLVTTPIFYAAVRDISERTQAVTMLLLHVPRRLAKALRERAQTGLDRMVAEQEDHAVQLADVDATGIAEGGGMQDEEEEKRLFVQQEDGEEAYRAILRAAEKQVARRMRTHLAT